jgi:hypothetical protein
MAILCLGSIWSAPLLGGWTFIFTGHPRIMDTIKYGIWIKSVRAHTHTHTHTTCVKMSRLASVTIRTLSRATISYHKVKPQRDEKMNLSLSLWFYSPFLDLSYYFTFLNLYNFFCEDGKKYLLLYSLYHTIWRSSTIFTIYRRYDSWDRGATRRKAATYTQNNTNIEQTQTFIHTLSGIRTHDLSAPASENSSCLRPRPK